LGRGAVKMFILLEPYRMNSGPEIREYVFQATCSLVFVMGMPHLLQVCMMQLLPVGMEVAVEHVIPTYALLLVV
jgi:hypothetical protein